jgi:hypothetical protein
VAQPAEPVPPQRLGPSRRDVVVVVGGGGGGASSLPFELLKLVAENLLIHNASRLLAQSLASFAAASTTCLAVTQGELRAALVTAL